MSFEYTPKQLHELIMLHGPLDEHDQNKIRALYSYAITLQERVRVLGIASLPEQARLSLLESIDDLDTIVRDLTTLAEEIRGVEYA